MPSSSPSKAAGAKRQREADNDINENQLPEPDTLDNQNTEEKEESKPQRLANLSSSTDDGEERKEISSRIEIPSVAPARKRREGTIGSRRIFDASLKNLMKAHDELVAARKIKEAEALAAASSNVPPPFHYQSKDEREKKKKGASNSARGVPQGGVDTDFDDDDDDYEIVVEKVLVRVPVLDHFTDLGFDRQMALLARTVRFEDLETAHPKMYFVVDDGSGEKVSGEVVVDRKKTEDDESRTKKKGEKKKEPARQEEQEITEKKSDFLIGDDDPNNYFVLRPVPTTITGGGNAFVNEAVTATHDQFISTMKAASASVASVSTNTHHHSSSLGPSTLPMTSAPPSLSAPAYSGSSSCVPVQLYRKVAPLSEHAKVTAAFQGVWEGSNRRKSGLTDEVLCTLVRDAATSSATSQLVVGRGGGGADKREDFGADEDPSSSSSSFLIPSIFGKDTSIEKGKRIGGEKTQMTAGELQRKRYAGNTLHRQLTTGSSASEEVEGWVVESVLPIKSSITMSRIL